MVGSSGQRLLSVNDALIFFWRKKSTFGGQGKNLMDGHEGGSNRR
jgi:hypothetical protein